MTEPTTLPCRNVVLRRPRTTNLLVLLGLALVVVGFPFAGALLGWAGALVVLLGALAAFVQAARVMSTGRGGGTISLEEGALRIVDGAGGVRVVPLADIESGYETPTDGAAVLLLRNGAQLHVRLKGDAPSRILAHAGVGTSQRTLTLPLRGQLGAFTIGFIVMWPLVFAWSALLGGGPGRFLVALLLTALSTALVVKRFGFPRVVVGTDGIRVLGGLRARYFPYATIAGVDLEPAAYAHLAPTIVIRFRDRSPRVLPTIAAPRERVEGLARRITQAVAAHATSSAQRLDGLARGGRSVDDWRTDLKRMALAPPGFRDHALGPDDFQRVLADAAAPPEQRIGAALAIRAIDPEAGPARIRVAADASADDALRAALASAAEGEIDDAMRDRATARRATR